MAITEQEFKDLAFTLSQLLYVRIWLKWGEETAADKQEMALSALDPMSMWPKNGFLLPPHRIEVSGGMSFYIFRKRAE